MSTIPKDPFSIILTSVGVELLSFRKKTGKITNDEEEHLTSAIVERIVRKLKEHGCYQLATDGREELEKENGNLKTVMIAAAEEINAHWQAHCDEEGYGPSSLMYRLEQGIPSEYGYKAGRFEEMKNQITALQAEVNEYSGNLKNAVEQNGKQLHGYYLELQAKEIELKEKDHIISKYHTEINETVYELEELKKQLKEKEGLIEVLTIERNKFESKYLESNSDVKRLLDAYEKSEQSIKEKEKECEEYREGYRDLSLIRNNLVEERNQYREKFEELKAENERLKSLLNPKQ